MPRITMSIIERPSFPVVTREHIDQQESMNYLKKQSSHMHRYAILPVVHYCVDSYLCLITAVAIKVCLPIISFPICPFTCPSDL
jgi:hypothetical protein